MFGKSKIEELVERIDILETQQYDLLGLKEQFNEMKKELKQLKCPHQMKYRKIINVEQNICSVIIKNEDKAYEICDNCEKEFQVINNEEDISKRRVEISKGIIKEEKAKLKEK